VTTLTVNVLLMSAEVLWHTNGAIADHKTL